jgi:O-antigen/teichoic acid export membrane protein
MTRETPRPLLAPWRALSYLRLRSFDDGTPEGRSSERYRRIALATASSVLVRGLSTLANLAIIPILLGHLGKAGFGLWSAVTLVIAWIGVFDLGIAAGLVNCISRAHGRDDREDAGRLVGAAFVMLAWAAGGLGVLAATIGPLLPWSALLAVRGTLPDGMVTLAALAAIAAFALGLPVSIAPQIYAGYQRTYVANSFSLLGIVVGFGGLVMCVRTGASIPVLVGVYGLGAALGSGAALLHAFRTMPWLRPRRGTQMRAAAAEIARRSLPLFLFQVGALAVNEAQILVLAHRRDLATVAEYAILWRIYVVFVGLVQVSTASFVPAFREAAERGDVTWVRVAFRRFVRIRLALGLLAGMALVLAGDLTLALWLGADRVAFGRTTWAAAASLLLATTWATSHAELLAIMDRLWFVVGLVAMNGAVTIALTWVLAPRLGVLGALLAMAGVTVAIYSWLLPWVARRTVLGPRPE